VDFAVFRAKLSKSRENQAWIFSRVILDSGTFSGLTLDFSKTENGV